MEILHMYTRLMTLWPVHVALRLSNNLSAILFKDVGLHLVVCI